MKQDNRERPPPASSLSSAHHPDPKPYPPWNHSPLSLKSYIVFIVLTMPPRSSDHIHTTIQSTPTHPVPGALCLGWGHRAFYLQRFGTLSPPSLSRRLVDQGLERGHRWPFDNLSRRPPPPLRGRRLSLPTRFPRETPSAPSRRAARGRRGWSRPQRVPSCGQRAPHPPPRRGAARHGALTPRGRPCPAAAPPRHSRRARRS